MRKKCKENIEKYIDLLPPICEAIKVTMQSNPQEAECLLSECCQGLSMVKKQILESEGEGCKTLELIEKYEATLPQGDNAVWEELRRSIAQDIKAKKEVVFLPYKASMWDSLESVWVAARDDEECDAYVVPIPYYDKDSEHNFTEMHWEGELYPDYVPITHYTEYDICTRRPDVIFIHNPYDEYNHVTSVHPDYYAKVLKQYTNRLIYVPYYILPSRPSENDSDFVLSEGVMNSDMVFVQSEEIKAFYLDTIRKSHSVFNAEEWSSKIIAVGSPKTDKIINTKREKLQVPKEWSKIISGKKVIFFNTNVRMILKNADNIIDNLKRIFDIFRLHPEFAVIWREHPLTMPTLDAVRPEIKQAYIELRDAFVREKWGILDTTPDPHMAMILSDCYFGAGGSLSAVYPVTGKPIMIMDYLYPKQISQAMISLEELIGRASLRMLYVERNINSLELFLQNILVFEAQREERKERQVVRMNNLDGTVGEKIYAYAKGDI